MSLSGAYPSPRDHKQYLSSWLVHASVAVLSSLLPDVDKVYKNNEVTNGSCFHCPTAKYFKMWTALSPRSFVAVLQDISDGFLPIPYVAVHWSSVLIRSPNVPGLNLRPDIWYLDWLFMDFFDISKVTKPLFPLDDNEKWCSRYNVVKTEKRVTGTYYQYFLSPSIQIYIYFDITVKSKQHWENSIWRSINANKISRH